MPQDLPRLLERIRELADTQPDVPPQPLLARMEHTLTDGYAHALALEGESLRIERDIAALLAQMKDSEQAADVRALAARLARAENDLARLREQLDDLRRRAEGVRRMASEAPAV